MLTSSIHVGKELEKANSAQHTHTYIYIYIYIYIHTCMYTRVLHTQLPTHMPNVFFTRLPDIRDGQYQYNSNPIAITISPPRIPRVHIPKWIAKQIWWVFIYTPLSLYISTYIHKYKRQSKSSGRNQFSVRQSQTESNTYLSHSLSPLHYRRTGW